MRTSRVFLAAGGVMAVAVLAWAVLPAGAPAQTPPASPSNDVPVTIAKAAVGDVKVLLDGLGTVQAFNTVEVKAQVNGTLLALPAKEGQEVHTGDIVAEIDPRPYQAALDQATAQRDKDQATLQSQQLNLKRYSSLAKSQFAPVQQVDDQQATVNATLASIAADTAMMETAKINLGYCTIRAPINGRISLYQVDAGNIIQTANQTPIITITQDKPIAVVFTLPEQELTQVQDARKRGDVPVLVANNNDPAPIAEGTLMTPNNTIDTSTGTISLKAQFPNDDDHLWPGQFVNARVQVNTLKQAVTVPTLAIEHGPTGLFVYQVQPDNTVQAVTVQAGYADDGRTVITKGLKGGETVVIGGQSRLSPGTHVRINTAPQTADDSTQQPG